MTHISTVTQKGQVTIPLEIRKFLGIEKYEQVVFEKKGTEVIIKPAPSFLELRGMFSSQKKYSDDEADKAVMNHYRKTPTK